ncbi:MAG: hypothetical protein WBR18_02255 [Anaerolineales bacterium]
MKNVPFRLLQTDIEEIQKLLVEEGVLVITSKGKAFAIMIDVEEDTVEVAQHIVAQVRAGKAVAALRMAAKEKGLDVLTMEEVEEEVRKAKTDRGEGSPNSRA